MYKDLYIFNARLIPNFRESPADTFYRLIGKNIDCIENETMYGMWAISGSAIDIMYHTAYKDRTGV